MRGWTKSEIEGQVGGMAKKKTGKTQLKLSVQKEPHKDKSRRLSELTRQPNPPRRSVKSGRKGQK